MTNEETVKAPPPEHPAEPASMKGVSWEISASSTTDSEGYLKPSHSRQLPYYKASHNHFRLRKKRSRSSRKSSREGVFASIKRRIACCDCDKTSSDSDDSDKNDDIESLCKSADEDEIIARLQHAVNELGHRPTSYEIESEVMRWQKTLELEQKTYEEHGKPKFKYKWFRRNQYLMVKRHPLYATKYENQRKLETRVEEFRFGVSTSEEARIVVNEVKAKHSYNAHAHLKYYEEAINYGSGYWMSDKHVFLANLALITSIGNFLRFPQICYANGGFTFLFSYLLLLALVGQPLLYFEMLLGQFSLNGPAGFGQLHPWASGIPYAIGFVCVFFGISKNIFLLYTALYFLVGLIYDPGECGSWSHQYQTKCFPYDRIEKDMALLQAERKNADYENEDSLNISIFSVDLYFREVALDVDWKKNGHSLFIHWKMVISTIFVICMTFFVLRNGLTGKVVRKYLKYTVLSPIMMSMLLLHQAFTRGAFDTAVAYFVSIDTDHIYVLSIWGTAFEMVLSTLGIGYGFHWAIAGKARFDFRGAYDISWRICGYAGLFALLSSLVLYCEIGIVGELITGDPNQFHVFFERLGISFVCYSGALIKVGYNTPVAVVIFFLVLTVFGMWSQIVATEVLFRWIDRGYIIKGHSQRQLKRKSTAVILVVIIQLCLFAPHIFKLGAPVIATDNIFEGYFAAYGVLLAELLTIVYLYGFGRFLVDVEIMTKHRLPALFQIQIRYIVVPTISLFMILMMIDAVKEPTLYTDRRDLGLAVYVGVFANLMPVIIIIAFAQYHWFKKFKAPTNKVNPEPFRYTRTRINPEKKMSSGEQRYVAKRNAPSQYRVQNIRSEVFQELEVDMQAIYDAQLQVRQNFLDLLRFKRNQVRWLNLLFGVLFQRRIKKMRALMRRVMLGRKFANDRVDIRFLQHSVQQFIHLPFYASQRKLALVPKEELYQHLANELMKATAFHLKDYNTDTENSSDSSSSSSDILKSPSATLSRCEMEELDPKYEHLHRMLIGRLDRSEEELRTLLEIRIKRGLGIPHQHELEILTFLRRMRAKHEREGALWAVNMPLPIDHFVPASISHHGKKVAFTIFHAVIIEGSDHFVLKKLPVPRPTITRVTQKFIDENPGRSYLEKISQVVTKRMLQNARTLWQERNLKDWSGEQVHKHLRKVVEMIDEDVYNLDPITTCIVVIVPEEEVQQVKKQHKMYLTPPTRRKKKHGTDSRRRISSGRTSRSDFSITSYKAMTHEEIQQAKWNDLLSKAPDIIFHSYSDDSDFEIWAPDDTKSSSGSQSTFSPEEDNFKSSIASTATADSSRSSSLSSAGTAGTDVVMGRHVGRSRFLLLNETLQKRDRRSLIVHGGRTGEADFAEIKKLKLDPRKLRHLSARRWTRLHRKDPIMKYSKMEERLQNAIDEEARKRGDLPMVVSKSVELINVLDSARDIRRAISFESLRNLLRDEESEESVEGSGGGGKYEITKREREQRPKTASSDEAIHNANLEQRLANETTDLMYISLGKILVVDHTAIPLIGMGQTHKSTITLGYNLEV